MPLFQRPTAIRRKTLRMILGASKDAYPNEFGAFLRAEQGVITELLLIPGTIGGKRHALFQFHHAPPDFSVVGTVHSHPSGVFHPSDEDLRLFSKFGGLHIVTGHPYEESTWGAWDYAGRPVSLDVVP